MVHLLTVVISMLAVSAYVGLLKSGRDRILGLLQRLLERHRLRRDPLNPDADEPAQANDLLRDRDEYIIMDQWSYGAKPGEVIEQPRLAYDCRPPSCSDQRYEAILRSCTEKGWVEQLPDGGIRLTETGVAVRLQFSTR